MELHPDVLKQQAALPTPSPFLAMGSIGHRVGTAWHPPPLHPQSTEVRGWVFPLPQERALNAHERRG